MGGSISQPQWNSHRLGTLNRHPAPARPPAPLSPLPPSRVRAGGLLSEDDCLRRRYDSHARDQDPPVQRFSLSFSMRCVPAATAHLPAQLAARHVPAPRFLMWSACLPDFSSFFFGPAHFERLAVLLHLGVDHGEVGGTVRDVVALDRMDGSSAAAANQPPRGDTTRMRRRTGSRGGQRGE